MRSPVNDPGPMETANISMSAGDSARDSSMEDTMGSSFCECLRAPCRAYSARTAPFSKTAQVAVMHAVSMANVLMLPLLPDKSRCPCDPDGCLSAVSLPADIRRASYIRHVRAIPPDKPLLRQSIHPSRFRTVLPDLRSDKGQNDAGFAANRQAYVPHSCLPI